MRILHIFNNWVFTEPYIKFINNNFNERDHLFFVIKSSGKLSMPNYTNVLNFVADKKMKKNKVLLSLFKLYTYFSLFYQSCRSDKIILHSLSDRSLIKFLFFNPWFLRKSTWIIWGADIHYDKIYKRKWKTTFNEFIKRKVIKKLGGISGLTPGDLIYAKEKYEITAKEYSGMYVNTVTTDFLDSLVINKKDSVYIQIGNSADPSNLHFEMIDSLAKFKNENIKVFAPLAYGNKDHAQKVKKYGEEILGDRFEAMMTFMDPKNYSKFLGDIDILIYNHKRQQGLGNIYSLVYLGKKVFIRDDTSSWEFFRDNLNIRLENTLAISNMDFTEFIKYDENTKANNKIQARDTFYSEEYLKSLWIKIFEPEVI